MVWKGKEDQRNELFFWCYTNCQYFHLNFWFDFFHLMISRPALCPLSCAEPRLLTASDFICNMSRCCASVSRSPESSKLAAELQKVNERQICKGTSPQTSLLPHPEKDLLHLQAVITCGKEKGGRSNNSQISPSADKGLASSALITGSLKEWADHSPC